IRDGQRDPMLGEEREDAVVDPPAVTKLDGEFDVAGKNRQKVRQRRQLHRAEVRTKLDEDRTELLPQLSGAVEELLRDIGAVAQSSLVRDLLRQLERKSEAGWSSVVPAT